MIDIVARVESDEVRILDGRMRASAALSLSGEVQCSSPGLPMFKLVRNDDGSVDARFGNGFALRVKNLRTDD